MWTTKLVLKVLVGLAIVLPLGAYAVGAIAASAADDPAPRQTIQLEEPTTPTSTPASPRTRPTQGPSERGDDHGGDRKDGSTDDHGVETIVPDYDDLDDSPHADDHGGDRGGHGSDDRTDPHDGSSGGGHSGRGGGGSH